MEGAAAHHPVLLDEVLALIEPRGRLVLLDCTMGLGGHAEAMLSAAGDQANLVGIDLDERNLLSAKARLARFGGRCRLFAANFGDVREVLAEAGVPRVDALLADLGVCSWQIDDPSRGLSFMADGPLDMRLGSQERTAADLVNGLAEEALADLIFKYGEERYSRRIARAIVAARRTRPIHRTLELAEIVRSAVPAAARAARRGVHPATRTFQALRIAVNDEMGSLQRLLDALGDVLAPGGRAAIISFHSLEDRPVKLAFAAMAAAGRAKLLTKKPVTPGEEEISRNPRSRSAKLRAIEML
jgi:16S rRNA (cytosine1402-N4)-methyltransferase